MEDTGIGIAPADQRKLFEAFYQVKRSTTDKTPGTGLGLNLCKQFVEMHGGCIWIESEGLNKGSRFSFVLPMKPSFTEQSVITTEAGLGNDVSSQLDSQFIQSTQ